MPKNKNKGGKPARERRRQRRAHLVRPSSSVYGKVTPMVICYYGAFELTEKTWSDYFGMKAISFGNDQIFTGAYKKLRVFREYRLVRAHFKITFQVLRTAKWKKSTHSELSTFAVASFIQNYDVAVKPTALVSSEWDEICSHPGVKTTVLTSDASRTAHHTWIPTESTDTDWRLTDNDGLCHLYLVSRKLDKDEEGLFDTYGHFVSAIVESKVHIQLRGFDIQNDDTFGIKSHPSSPYVAVLRSSSSTEKSLNFQVQPPPSPTFNGPSEEYRPVSPVLEEDVASFVSVGQELNESFGQLSV